MVPVSTIVQALELCHALDQPQLDELRRDLLPAHREDWRGLAAALLKRRWLTPFQINRLSVNRGHELLLGSYVLLERLGEGGMGAVFKARNWKLGQTVALKLIRKDLLTNKTVVERFRREITATAQLDHPNLIRAFDADETEDGLFIVMEYVEGIDLCRLVAEQGPLPAARACEYIRQAALGLQHAHERGLVHRDVKPPNLFLASNRDPGLSDSTGGPRPPFAEGTIKLLDLGLARLQDSALSRGAGAQPALTQLGVIVGTVDFIAPEQARDSRNVDIRADLYSLGCTLCYLLTGKAPFPSGTATEKLIKHSCEPPPALSNVPHAVRAVVHKLMAKSPADRYQTPAELAETLAALLARPDQLNRACAVEELPPTVPIMSLPRPAVVPQGASRVRKRIDHKSRPARILPPRPKPEAAPAVEPPLATAVEEPPPAATTAPRRRRRAFRLVAWLIALAGLSVAGGVIAYPVVFPATPAPEKDDKPDSKPIEPKPTVTTVVVREFLTAGPYGIFSDVPAQVEKDPLPGARYRERLSGSISGWQPRLADTTGHLKVPTVPAMRMSVLYAQAHILAPKSCRVKMKAGLADVARLLVNDRVIYNRGNASATAQPEEDWRDLDLEEGWNRVLVRLESRTGQPFDFHLSLQGQGLRSAAKPGGDRPTPDRPTRP